MVQVKRLYMLLKMPIEVDLRRSNCISYELAHKLGLSVEQEYELLTIRSEGERQAFLLRHLERAIPVVAEMEAHQGTHQAQRPLQALSIH
jgi:hypothetical protein